MPLWIKASRPDWSESLRKRSCSWPNLYSIEFVSFWHYEFHSRSNRRCKMKFPNSEAKWTKNDKEIHYDMWITPSSHGSLWITWMDPHVDHPSLLIKEVSIILGILCFENPGSLRNLVLLYAHMQIKKHIMGISRPSIRWTEFLSRQPLERFKPNMEGWFAILPSPFSPPFSIVSPYVVINTTLLSPQAFRKIFSTIYKTEV